MSARRPGAAAACAIAALAAAGLAGCLAADVVHCADGTVCAAGLACEPAGGGCVDPRFCVDLADGTPCAGLEIAAGACAGGACVSIVCGDGVVGPGETCDDGNQRSHDGCGGCAPEEPRWIEVTPTISPPARRGHAMAYDPFRGRVVLFGGAGDADILGDTWEWDGVEWHDVTPSNGSPPARDRHAVVFDPRRRRVLLVGGRIDVLDAWEWDGVTWTDVTPAGAGPAPRVGHVLVRDASRILLSGGEGLGLLADTWAWDGRGWTELGGAAPTARYHHDAAYDPVADRAIVYGGLRDTGVGYADTWLWDGERWDVDEGATTPGPRYYHAVTYDGDRAALTLFGGRSGFESVADTWMREGGAWSVLAPPSSPSARTEHAMAHDDVRRGGVLFGGYDGAESAARSDTWILRFEGGAPDEDCPAGGDADGDGLGGCDDPDCWARCTPACPPGAPCDADAPRCGDGACNEALESCALCPGDCGACR